MQIPSVSKLRHEVQLKLSENRKRIEERETKFCINLVESHNLLVEHLFQCVLKKAVAYLQANPSGVAFSLFNPGAMFTDPNKFKLVTLMKGFWNPYKKQHERNIHVKAGLINTPLQDLNERLNMHGYYVIDISNSKLSFNTVYQVVLTDEDSKCSICYDTFNANNLHCTKCNHMYHINCIQKWQEYNKTCPMCRRSL